MGPRVLVACESSGRVRRAFRAAGCNALSCDLLPADDGSPYHILGDVRDVLQEGWDLMVAHPPCTYLSSSGIHWTARGLRDPALTDAAVAFVEILMNAPIRRIAIENPVGVLSSRIRRPDQVVQPYNFGEDASKRTCLWLKELPLLNPTIRVPGRLVSLPNGRTVERWSNQGDSGQSRLGPSSDRWRLRSLTYEGIASAMAQQWAPLL